MNNRHHHIPQRLRHLAKGSFRDDIYRKTVRQLRWIYDMPADLAHEAAMAAAKPGNTLADDPRYTGRSS